MRVALVDVNLPGVVVFLVVSVCKVVKVVLQGVVVSFVEIKVLMESLTDSTNKETELLRHCLLQEWEQ